MTEIPWPRAVLGTALTLDEIIDEAHVGDAVAELEERDSGVVIRSSDMVTNESTSRWLTAFRQEWHQFVATSRLVDHFALIVSENVDAWPPLTTIVGDTNTVSGTVITLSVISNVTGP